MSDIRGPCFPVVKKSALLDELFCLGAEEELAVMEYG